MSVREVAPASKAHAFGERRTRPWTRRKPGVDPAPSGSGRQVDFKAGVRTMGGLAVANMTDPDRIWTEASVRLRAEIGEGPFSSYIAPSAVRADGAGQLILVTPTGYARDWVRKNALRRLNELWLGLDGLSRRRLPPYRPPRRPCRSPWQPCHR